MVKKIEMQYRNLDALDVSLWGRQAAFERDLMKALREVPQSSDVTLSRHIHDSVVIDAGDLTAEDVESALASLLTRKP